MSEAAIDLKGLTCKVGRFQLGPLDFIAPRGSVTAFIGPNGAGKTTTLDLIMGMGRPSGGAIRVLGMDQPRDEAQIKARIGYVSPDLNFAIWGSVARALNFMKGFYPDWDDGRCARLLAEFGLKRSDRIVGLSFGSRIKLSLVMALSHDPDLLLLDEPTVGLDVASRLNLFSEILAFIKREDRAVVISSHQLADLERLADRLVILSEGKVLAAGAMDALMARFVRLDATAPDYGAVPEFDGVKVIGRDGERVRLLVDLDKASRADVAAARMQIVEETPMTLEELFIALTGGRA